jgi:hypothetical protein
MMKFSKPHIGLALMFIGAVLLVLCKLVGWQSNAELLTGLAMVVMGYVLYIWLRKHGEKY